MRYCQPHSDKLLYQKSLDGVFFKRRNLFFSQLLFGNPIHCREALQSAAHYYSTIQTFFPAQLQFSITWIASKSDSILQNVNRVSSTNVA